MSVVTYALEETHTFKISDQRRVTEELFPDPFVWRAGDAWYAIATGPSSDGRIFPLMMSRDFSNWVSLPGAVEPLIGLGDDYWAPEVIEFEGEWLLFFSVGSGDHGHQLRLARAEKPEGPYVHVESPVLDPSLCSFAIDAHPYLDAEGRLWLFYARDLLDGDRPGTSLVVAPLGADFKLGADFTVVARANSDWQIYMRDREIYGGRYDWHTLEGPSVVEHGGKLVLFYSGGNWTNSTYGVDWLSSTSVEGPWVSDMPEAPRFLRTSQGLVGPGHNSFVVGPDSKLWTAFHAWDPTHTKRQMWLARVDWD